jgi:hypothetical protein
LILNYPVHFASQFLRRQVNNAAAQTAVDSLIPCPANPARDWIPASPRRLSATARINTASFSFISCRIQYLGLCAIHVPAKKPGIQQQKSRRKPAFLQDRS